MSLTAVKIRIRRLLPAKLFSLFYGAWRHSAMIALASLERIKLRRFTESVVRDIEYKQTSFKLVINPGNGFIDNYVYLHGVYEDYILDVIAEHLPPGGVFIDVGANIGQHSLFAAAHLNGTGKVYAFEPLLTLFRQFSKSVDLNNFQNLELFNFACGNTTEQKKIFSNTTNAGQTSLVSDLQAQSSVEVMVRRLDDVLVQVARVDCIKIDVEGFEYEVLLGAQRLLAQTRPVIILEFSPHLYNQFDSTVSEKILSFLTVDYALYDIDGGGYPIGNIQEFYQDFTRDHRAQTNLLGIPKTGHENV